MTAGQPAAQDASLDELLAFIHRARGFDFGGYKRGPLERRLRKRMQEVGVADYEQYLDRLQVEPDEFQALFDTILINVTAFFRDPQAWAFCADEIVPRLLDSLGPEEPIRVWCAGCASGEETYTLAIVLGEALGQDAYLRRVKIYGTEVDEGALEQARNGAYTAKQLEPVPRHLVERYFERVDRRYLFRRDLRRTMIFGLNDLTQDAPISRIDLLTCRNTLMYFNAEVQAEILRRLHFALNPRGYLFLGKSEMLIAHADLFRPVDLRRRVFTKAVKGLPARGMHNMFPSAPGAIDPAATDIRDTAFDAAPAAQVVVDVEGTVVLANAQARTLFGVSAADVGRPLKDLELSYRPADLRTHLDAAYAEGRPVTVGPVTAAQPRGQPRELYVQIVPLRSAEQLLGASIAFADVTRQRAVEQELETARRELEMAYDQLQSTVEELETTNEELQTTNEELETTNEELQSTNEELETMNEELQSTNEELETINDELRDRSRDLNDANTFLSAILSTLRIAVIVIDQDHVVRAWNSESAELWGLRADEVEGQDLDGLDFGMPLDGLQAALGDVLSGAEERIELALDATNRRGRQVRLHVTCAPMRRVPGEVTGAVLMTEAIATEGQSAGASDGG